MKRGLKEITGFGLLFVPAGCRVFPDEEGTESVQSSRQRNLSVRVAEYSPMKRGLKAIVDYM